MSKVVYKYGKLCASHPWEVIVLFLTLSIIILSITPHPSHNQIDEDVRTNCNGNPSDTLSNHHFHQEVGKRVCSKREQIYCQQKANKLK